MTNDMGFVQVYTGNGKGKTTAAFGAVLRAAGHGKRCYIGQFMKGILYGEVEYLRNHDLIEIEQFGDINCIRKSEVTKKHIKLALEGLEKVKGKIGSGRYELIVLDEINVALWFGLIPTNLIAEIIDNKPFNLELILTGRYAPDEIIKRADLVTEMNEIKHYYTRGIEARDGFER